MGILPIFILQFAVMALAGHWLPQGLRLTQYDAAATAVLRGRLIFDGLGIILSVTVGYSGLVYVSVTEGRRHLRLQLEKASLESEMAAAREMQRVMVPDVLPPIAGYYLESVYHPAAEVGGDFFQVVPLQSGRSLVVIGDVSGKGLRAAMVVSMIVGMLRTVSGFTEEPAEILGELNRRLCGRTHGGFATCLALRLENGGQLVLANAGHPPPYLNGTELAFPGSMPLGLVETAAYEQTSLEMRAGDVAVLLTDGIVEAQNSHRELLGFSRVGTLLRAGATARSIADIAQQHGQNDDITVISVACEA
jgi:serine phosphatase RsbU (regulator of sigma subunit)